LLFNYSHEDTKRGCNAGRFQNVSYIVTWWEYELNVLSTDNVYFEQTLARGGKRVPSDERSLAYV